MTDVNDDDDGCSSEHSVNKYLSNSKLSLFDIKLVISKMFNEQVC